MQLCPDAIFLRPSFEVYRAISQTIQAIYRRYTPLVEPLALDEAYLDVTSLVGEEREAAAQVAREIKHAIIEQTELTASIGVSHKKCSPSWPVRTTNQTGSR